MLSLLYPLLLAWHRCKRLSTFSLIDIYPTYLSSCPYLLDVFKSHHPFKCFPILYILSTLSRTFGFGPTYQ
ncbi:hypothetical protein GGS20DRAFT_531683 [Poronia punctata]|nr:hypothetical protein GGS20DRAFT_531683 [Poronia punctata]